MDSIVKVVRGDSLETKGKPCVFCGEASGASLLAVTAGKKYDGTHLRTFSMCEEHFEKVNALLSGEFDIDKILLEKHRQQGSRSTLKLRG